MNEQIRIDPDNNKDKKPTRSRREFLKDLGSLTLLGSGGAAVVFGYVKAVQSGVTASDLVEPLQDRFGPDEIDPYNPCNNPNVPKGVPVYNSLNQDTWRTEGFDVALDEYVEKICPETED